MAKKTFTHDIETDEDGNVLSVKVVEQRGLTRAQRESTKLMPWTKGPGTSKAKRAARALWG